MNLGANLGQRNRFNVTKTHVRATMVIEMYRTSSLVIPGGISFAARAKKAMIRRRADV
jgi:hypothetical protein